MTPTKEQFEAAAQSAESDVWLKDENDCRFMAESICGVL